MSLLLLMAAVAVAQAPGRLLYANDDDWDWLAKASAEPSPLGRDYGPAKWSAMDWAEEGLADPIRRAVIGRLPASSQIDLAALQAARPGEWSVWEARPGAFTAAIRDAKAHVIVVVDESGYGEPHPLSDADRRELVAFLRRGGRLVALDDGAKCGALFSALIEKDPISRHAQAGARPSGFEPPPPRLPTGALGYPAGPHGSPIEPPPTRLPTGPQESPTRPPDDPARVLRKQTATQNGLTESESVALGIPFTQRVGVPNEVVDELAKLLGALGAVEVVDFVADTGGGADRRALRLIMKLPKKR